MRSGTWRSDRSFAWNRTDTLAWAAFARRAADIAAKSMSRKASFFALVPASAALRNFMYHAQGATKSASMSGNPANHVGIMSAARTPAAPNARKIDAHFCGFRLKYAASFSSFVETITA